MLIYFANLSNLLFRKNKMHNIQQPNAPLVFPPFYSFSYILLRWRTHKFYSEVVFEAIKLKKTYSRLVSQFFALDKT